MYAALDGHWYVDPEKDGCTWEGHAQPLQPRHARRENRLRVHLAQRVLHPPPDGGLCLRGDLLADDVVDDGGKEIRVDRAVNIPYAVNDRAQSPIPVPQVRKLRLAVWKVHAHSPFVPVSGWVNFCGR